LGDPIAIYAALATVAAITIGAATALVLPPVGEAYDAASDLSRLSQPGTFGDSGPPLRHLRISARRALWLALLLAAPVLLSLAGWCLETRDAMTQRVGLLLPFVGVVALGVVLLVLVAVVNVQSLYWARKLR
jgi:hypothetical protein